MSSASESNATSETRPKITVKDLTMAYGDSVVVRDLNFSVNEREIFIIMGGSGSGKSTLLRHLIGLQEPARGTISYQGTSSDLWEMTDARTRAPPATLRSPLPGGRPVELDDARGERRPPDAGVRRRRRGGDRRARLAQALPGRSRRLRGLLPRGDQRRHDQAGWPGTRHGARPGHPLLRRAVRGSGSDQLAAPGRPHPRSARQPRRHDRRGDPRAGEHLRHRRQLRAPRRAEQGR